MNGVTVMLYILGLSYGAVEIVLNSLGMGIEKTNEQDHPLRVDDLIATLPAEAWSKAAIKDGSKGPIVCHFAFRASFQKPDGIMKSLLDNSKKRHTI